MTDTDRRTEPALTAEEWRESEIESHYGHAATRLHVDHKGRIFVHSTMGDEHAVVILNEAVDADRVRAGVAALCLHGHPFGFTPEDVEHLRVIADYFRAPGWDTADWAWLLEGLAARIAALLPPR